MKKFLCIILVTLCSLFTYSQTTSPQNTVARVDYLGYSNGNHIFKLSNTQTCDVTMQYYFVSNTGKKTNITVPANSFVNLSLASAQLTTETIKAKATSFCPGTASDPSWIEVASTGVPLPIKFGKISAVRVTNSIIRLTFESEEDHTIKYYNIMISEDGKVFKKVTMIFPNGMIGNKTYSVLINL